MRFLTCLLCCLLLSGCRGAGVQTVAANSSPETAGADASSSQQRQFENAIARKIFSSVKADLPGIPTRERPGYLAGQIRQIEAAVDLSLLTSSTRLEYDLLLYLSTHPPGSPAADFPATIRQLTSLDDSLEKHERRLNEELSRLDQTIGVLAAKNPVAFDLPAHMQQVRERTAYPADTFEGRQTWLDALSRTMFEMQIDWHSLLQTYPQSALEVSGTENSRQTLAYRRGLLRVDLTRVTDLPLFELRALAAYYGYPGLQSLVKTGSKTQGLQAFLYLPAYSLGWAAYITEYIATRETRHTLDYLYFLKTLAALAMVDLKLGQDKWTADEALDYLVTSTPYSRNRLRLWMENLLENPGVYLAGTMGKLEFVRIHQRCMVTQGRCDAAFHQKIVDLEPIPFEVLKTRL